MWIILSVVALLTIVTWNLPFLGASHVIVGLIWTFILFSLLAVYNGGRRWLANLDDMIEDEEYYDKQLEKVNTFHQSVSFEAEKVRDKLLKEKEKIESIVSTYNKNEV